MYSFQISIIKIYTSNISKISLSRPFKSFTSFSYKISLIKCLTDRSFKICKNWNSFHNDIESIKFSVIKNAYLPFLKYLNVKFSSNQNQFKDTSDFYYFKLSYIGNLSHHIKINFQNFAKSFVKKRLTLKAHSQT